MTSDDTSRQRSAAESENERNTRELDQGLFPIGRRRLLKASAATGALGAVASTNSAASLSSPWSNRDIGNVDASGSASNSNGTFTVEGAGEDIWGTADEFHYGYQTLSGDGVAIAEVTSQEYTNAWSKAGVMIREDLSADSKHAMMNITGGSGTQFLWRDTAGGSTDSSTPADGVTEPYYVKIEREGDTLTGYKSSPNGNSWVTVGTAEVAMSTDVHVGLAVTSHNAGTLCTTTFENVAVSESLWDNRDVGAVDASGGFSIDNGVYTVDGGGEDIWGTADEFHYAYRKMSGNGSAEAEVTWFNHAQEWSKAGVMIREDLSADSKNAMMTMTGGHGTQFQWRDTTGGTSDSYVPGDGIDEPHYVKVERRGHTFIGYKSTDGSNWTELDRVTVEMGTDVYAGLAVTSNSANNLSAAEFENVDLKRTGLAMAGGPGYNRPIYPGEADHTVSSDDWTRLKNLLESNADPGDIVYITSDITVPQDTSHPLVDVQDDLTIAGDRGIDNSSGPTIHLDELEDSDGNGSQVFHPGSNNRFTGLDIQGPTPDAVAYGDSFNTAIRVDHPGVEIDNCEIHAWDGMGVWDFGGDAYVHNCDIHHNRGEGYGYGVSASGRDPGTGAHPTVRYCNFDYNRHSIPAKHWDGDSDSVNGYTAEDCWFGPNHTNTTFDHHGPADSTEMNIRNCTIEDASNYGQKLRHQDAADSIGIPGSMNVENVWFHHDRLEEPCRSGNAEDDADNGSNDDGYVEPIWIVNADDCDKTWSDLNVYLTNNHYGTSEPSGDVGAPR